MKPLWLQEKRIMLSRRNNQIDLDKQIYRPYQGAVSSWLPFLMLGGFRERKTLIKSGLRKIVGYGDNFGFTESL